MQKNDETDVKTRQKRKLAALREKKEQKDEYLSRASGDNRSNQTPVGGVSATSGTTEGTYGPDESGTQGMEVRPGIAGGHDTGVRQTDAESLYSAQSNDRIDNASRTSELTPEQEEERQKELHRQRQQRYLDRKKAKEDDNLSFFPSPSSQIPNDANEKTKFTLKNPFPQKNDAPTVKLFTAKEAEDEKERLTFVYLHGSSLLDDILEIIVRGHEKIAIWQLEDGEATMLAEMHLDRARKDSNAARSARVLLSIYDRLFILMLVGPRMASTVQHVGKNGGLSFK